MTPVRTPTDGRLSSLELERLARTDVAAITGKYLSITSYRRERLGVSTPVWFATEGDRLLVMTDSRSGKVKRIRRDPYVTIAPCSARGKPKAKGMPARAEILPASEVERSKRLIERKYRFDLLFVRPIRAIQKLFRPERRREVTAIVSITAPHA
jgi:PPOX class probable F420-dependent enzyme